MKVMFKNRFLIAAPLVFVLLTLASFFSLTMSSVSADDAVVDNVSITVSAACTMNGTGMNTHNATVNPGTYETNIGQTTFNVFCNDSEGFAVYAIGFTDDTDGKNVLTNAALGSSADIVTGTATTGNSQWAMKLATDSGATYPITLQNGFGSWHTVPDDYALVAKRASSTDVGAGAVGASFTSTYQVFISSNQPAGDYSGRVKYVMVHPNDTSETPVKSDQIGVIFDGNGLTFSGGTSENRVVYGCDQMYQGEPDVIKSSNLANDGTKIRSYSSDDSVVDTKTFSGADKVLVVVDYGLNVYDNITVVKGQWGGYDVDGEPTNKNYRIHYSIDEMYELVSDTKTYTIDGDSVSIEFRSWGDGTEGYDYGMYARLYPLYYGEREGAELSQACFVNYVAADGAYSQTLSGGNRWYALLDDNVIWFENETEVLDYLEENKADYLGTTMRLNAYNQYKVAYNGNNATGGTMNGFYTTSDLPFDSINLAAPNFYKSNYGFAGWSEDQNATVNGRSKIYGPNENVPNADLNYNFNSHDTTLYAVWVPSAGNLQGWTGCSTLGQGQVTALTDSRDNNTYAVAKLADGNCWMIENLRLDAANSSDSSKAQGFGGVFSGLANSESSNFSNTTTSNSKYSTSNITGGNQAYRIPRYNNSNTNSSVTNMTTVDDNLYGYGNYYNWPATIANTVEFAQKNDNPNTSICPSSWKLPSGGEDSISEGTNDYYNLSLAIIGIAPKHYVGFWSDTYDDGEGANAFHAMMTYPNNFVLSNHISGSSIDHRGVSYQYNYGYYQTSTSNSQSSNYILELQTGFDGDYVGGGSRYNSKFYGNSVRCFIKNNN